MNALVIKNNNSSVHIHSRQNHFVKFYFIYDLFFIETQIVIEERNSKQREMLFRS